MIYMIGQQYHHLIVLERTENNKNRKPHYLCMCDCGKTVETSGDMLRWGKRKSCGCHHGENNTRHGMTDSRLYTIWCNMKARCSNPRETGYKNYGGRGITVCAEWISSFDQFMHWAVNNGYGDILEIDRIDFNGHYQPNNCRFVTEAIQSNNKRNNRILTVDGVTKTIKQFADEYHIASNTVRNRILINGMSHKDALTKPVRNKNKRTGKLLHEPLPTWINGGNSK